MKKILWVIPVIFLSSCFGFYQLASAGEESSNQPSLESRSEELAQELEKSKEMTQIWKDHVRTLTKERNEAYQEIERLKNQALSVGSQSRVLRKGEIETQPLVNPAAFQDLQRNYQAQTEKLKEMTSQLQMARSQGDKVSSDDVSSDVQDQIKDLNYQIDRLRYDNERLKIAEKEAVDLRSQIDLFRSQQESRRVLQNELDSAKIEKEKILKERDALNHEVQNLRSQIVASQSDLDTVTADKNKITQAFNDYKDRFTSQKTELENVRSKVDQLEAENKNLRNTRDVQAKRIENVKTGLQSLAQNLNDQ